MGTRFPQGVQAESNLAEREAARRLILLTLLSGDPLLFLIPVRISLNILRVIDFAGKHLR